MPSFSQRRRYKRASLFLSFLRRTERTLRRGASLLRGNWAILRRGASLLRWCIPGVYIGGSIPGVYIGCSIPGYMPPSLPYYPVYATLPTHPVCTPCTTLGIPRCTLWPSCTSHGCYLRVRYRERKPWALTWESCWVERHPWLPDPKSVTVVMPLCALLLRLSRKKERIDRIDEG